MSNFFSRFAGLTKVLTVFVVLALIAAVLIVFTRDSTKRTIRVDFTSTNSLYEGSDVRILGVPVGTVDKVKAKGDHVEATMTYEGDVRLPTNVKAVIISPAIVGDRFVQLAPAYSGGAVLPDNAKLGVDRTAVPVELDEIYQSLDDLSVALGPGRCEQGRLPEQPDRGLGHAARRPGPAAQHHDSQLRQAQPDAVEQQGRPVRQRPRGPAVRRPAAAQRLVGARVLQQHGAGVDRARGRARRPGQDVEGSSAWP